jgi:hypothetical protein
MVASTGSKTNKTAFITAHLEENPTANRKAVNKAWAEAGYSGTVSPTLVSKLRRDLGLAGNLRGRSKAAVANGSNGSPKAKGAKPKQTTKAKGGVRTEAIGQPSPPITSGTRKSSAGDRGRMIDEVEAGIDHLMFTLKVNGGMPEVESALRAARRLLTHSHMA